MKSVTRWRLVGLCWLLGIVFVAQYACASEPVWQWSVPMGEGRAFLWIPGDCMRVRAVMLAQHNMIEEGILEHETMRRELSRLGIAEVWVAPPFDRPFDFSRGAGERFDAAMAALATESGYTELALAPVIPLGHSACASFPWNFAAWNPARTLAVLSVKGDAPQTDLTGSGQPNPEWGSRNIDGVPGLMVMSEAEWWEARLTPLLRFRAAHPGTPLTVLADTGRGHFDSSDALIDFLVLFVRKAVKARLPDVRPTDGAVPLRSVDAASGWLVDRWREDEAPRAAAAPVASYTGNREEVFWCFDEEMARAVEVHQAAGRGKKRQQVDYVQDGQLAPISTTHAGVELKYLPAADGVTFQLAGEFISPLPPKAPVAAKDKPPAAVVVTPDIASDGMHASSPVRLSRITGPVRQIAPNTFRVQFNRTASTVDNRSHDIWLLAGHPGDDSFKGAVQQALLRLPRYTEGINQTITFPEIPDLARGITSLELNATSDAGLPVDYYVREGPAYLEGNVLHFTALPPRARLPVTVTVVAWQFGRASHPVKAATPVERSFRIIAGDR